MGSLDPDEGTLEYGGEPPEAVRRLKALCAAATIAHEAAFELHRRLRERGEMENERDQLLLTSARIATKEVPEACATAWDLYSRWKERIVLDPDGSDELLRDLASAVEECAPTLREQLDRQKAAVQALRDRLGT